MGTPLKDLKYYHLLIAFVFGLLCFGCASKQSSSAGAGVTDGVAVTWNKTPVPNFTKHNQIVASCPNPSSPPVICPTSGPTPTPIPNHPAQFCWYMSNGNNGYISYRFVDQWGATGSTHSQNNESQENCGSPLFSTTLSNVTVTTNPPTGASAGEVTITGYNANNKMVWVSFQNGCRDDDVNWKRLH